MKPSLKVTFLVTFILLFGTASALAQTPASTVTGSLSMGALKTAAQSSKAAAVFTSNVEYNFFKSYAIGVDLSYARAVHQFEYQASKGIEDTLVYLIDKELWKNPYLDLTLSFRLSAMLPTSEASQVASMKGAAIEYFSLKKGFGGRMSVSYGFSVTEYAYEYATFEEDGETIYNTRARFVNRLTFNYDFTRNLHFELGGAARSYYDFADDGPYEIFGVATSLSYDVQKQASINFGLSSATKDGSGITPWAGPAAADYMFGSKGVVISFGTTIRI